MPTTLDAIRAEALFASDLQCSDLRCSAPDRCDDRVRHTVANTLRRLGVSGCAARVAGEFGDHPETAVARMSWALGTVRSAYATRPATAAAAYPTFPASGPDHPPLALAS
jgi:hypothetical protein